LCLVLGLEGRARLADRTMACCSPAKPPVSAVRASSFSPIMWTFWRCFCGDLLRRASSFALSSQSGRPGLRCPPAPGPGRKPGLLGADGGVAVGLETGGVALAPPGAASPLRAATGEPSTRLGGGAEGRLFGFWSCISSPGATGLRIPGMPPGRGAPGLGAPDERPGPSPRPLLSPSLRMGLPTSSRPPAPERGWPGFVGALPGLIGAPGR
jgi:hypothetical protein